MSFANPIARAISILMVRHLSIGLVNYRNNVQVSDATMMGMAASVLRDGTALQTLEELLNLTLFARASMPIQGDIAEIGVYRGGSAKLLARYRGSRRLHLFDTFDGIPGSDTRDVVAKGDFAASIESVKAYLGPDAAISYHPGPFPSTAPEVNGSTFSLLHIDVDTYQGTRSALETMYGKMSPGAIIVSHDYSARTCPGVKAAIDEFFLSRPETIVPLAGTTQCLIIKQ